ncbi:hypothetical protein Hanom_Chr03g00267731 [Helianthus anomalus]
MASSTRCCKFQPSLRKPLQEGPMSPLLAPHLEEFTKPHAYCEMNDPGYFDDCSWCAIRKRLKASGTESRTSIEGVTPI